MARSGSVAASGLNVRLALTYNAHRIHYDRRYASDVEGYPGLVVQGPLQAIALAELCRRRHLPDRPMRQFQFRARRPAFEGAPLRLRGRLTRDDHVELVALNDAGQSTMTAQAELRRADGEERTVGLMS